MVDHSTTVLRERIASTRSIVYHPQPSTSAVDRNSFFVLRVLRRELDLLHEKNVYVRPRS